MAQFAQKAAEEETCGIYYEQVTAWFCDESGNISLITDFVMVSVTNWVIPM